MNGGSRIIAFGNAGEAPVEAEPHDVDEAVSPLEQAESPANASDERLDLSSAWIDNEDESALVSPEKRTFSKVPAAIALLVAAAWTGFFAWSHQSAITGGLSPAEWAALVSDWAVVILLVGVVWLVFMRNSTREAGRFGQAANLLSCESEQLEARLVTVNRELSLAREFLSSQSRDLESMGRVAVDRLSGSAERLGELVRENSDRIETIDKVGTAALENMDKLRGQLPVIASSAKDVTNNIGNAGRTAHAQIEDLVKGFKRINEFGKASESQVLSVRSLMEEAITQFTGQCDQLESIASRRFAELNERSETFRSDLEKQEIEALAAIRDRANALSEELGKANEALLTGETGSLEALRARLGSIRDEGAALAQALQDSEGEALQSWRTRLGEIEDTRSNLFARIQQADSEAVEAARDRLGGIVDEARLVEEGVAERRERLSEELEQYRNTAEAAEGEFLERFAAKLATLDEQLAQRSAVHREHGRLLAENAEGALSNLASYDERLNAMASAIGEKQSLLDSSLASISDKIGQSRDALSNTDRDIAKLTDSSIRLLELLRGGSEHIRADLPAVIKEAEEHLATFDIATREMRETIETAGRNGEFLANQITNSEASLKQIIVEIAQVQFALRDRSNSFDEVLSDNFRALADLESKSEKIAERVKGDLTEAIAALNTSAREAVSAISDHGNSEINALAAQLGEASQHAIDKAMQEKAAEAAGQLEQAASHAAGVSREATKQLRDQLAIVDELVGSLEQRVSRARERAEEQVDNDFARRAALITESLNSNAIDIAKALSNDVSDTAWEGYLRGDRGIFTRRAVNLIESGESKAIHQVYERDDDFREHVSRYIHDFEGMLRQVLSTRDGNAMGVTLLSSDMGKLYVALAQSIDRLRS